MRARLRSEQKTRIGAAAELGDEPGIRLIAAGGDVRAGEQAFGGRLAERIFEDLRFDTFVLSVGGADAEHGLTDFNPDDVRLKRAAVAGSRRLVADSTKLGRVTFARIGPTHLADVLVTDGGRDRGPGDRTARRRRQRGDRRMIVFDFCGRFCWRRRCRGDRRALAGRRAGRLRPLAVGPLFPTGLVWLARVRPALTSTVVAVSMVGGIACPSAIGLAVEAFGAGAVPWAMATLAVAGLATVAAIGRPHR